MKIVVSGFGFSDFTPSRESVEIRADCEYDVASG